MMLAKAYFSFHVNFEEEAWEQSSLPVAKGGLSIRKPTYIAPPAFLASAQGALVGMSNLLPERMCTEECAYEE